MTVKTAFASAPWLGIGAVVAIAHIALLALMSAWMPTAPAAVAGHPGELTIHIVPDRGSAPPADRAAHESSPNVDAVPEPTTVPVDVHATAAAPSEATPLLTASTPVKAPTVKTRRTRVKPARPAVTEPRPAPSQPQAVRRPTSDIQTSSGAQPNAAPETTDAAAGFTAPSASADYLDNPHPRYPKASLRRREAGTVMLALIVTADGRARDVRISRSSGHPALDRAALEAVRHWRFVPAKRMGRPVDAAYELPIHFKLKR